MDAKLARLSEHYSQSTMIDAAVKEFCTPPFTKKIEAAGVGQSGDRRLTLANGIAATLWGNIAAPRVLLVHGWGGRRAHMSAFVKPILARGFAVMAIDCWGHGDSPGEYTHGVRFAESIMQADREQGPFIAAIGHSVGAAAIVIAVYRNLRIEKAVLLAPPSIQTLVRQFTAGKGFDDETHEKFVVALAADAGCTFDEIDMLLLGAHLRIPILVMQDDQDSIVNRHDTEQFCALCPQAVLEKIEGVGHLRIMRSKAVIDRSVEFLAGT